MADLERSRGGAPLFANIGSLFKGGGGVPLYEYIVGGGGAYIYKISARPCLLTVNELQSRPGYPGQWWGRPGLMPR